MICPNCGKEYNEKMTCCISCGADLVPPDGPVCEEKETLTLIPESVSELPDETGFVRQLDYSEERDEVKIPLKSSRRPDTSAVIRFSASLLAAIAMCGFILASALFGVVRMVTDEKKIYEFSQTLDVMSLPASLTVLPVGRYNVPEEATVQEAIYVMSQGTGLSRDDIRTIYENSTAQEFVSEKLTGYAEYVRSGVVPERITAEQIKALFSENLSLIGSTMGHTLNDRDIEMVYSEIDRAEPFLNVVSPEKLETSLGNRFFEMLRLVGSAPAIIGAAAIAAAMLVVLKAINKKNSQVLTWGGGAVLAGGSAVLTATFLFSMQIPYSESDRLIKTVLKCACDVISPDLYRVGITLAVAGAVMLVWAGTLRKTARNSVAQM